MAEASDTACVERSYSRGGRIQKVEGLCADEVVEGRMESVLLGCLPMKGRVGAQSLGLWEVGGQDTVGDSRPPGLFSHLGEGLGSPGDEALSLGTLGVGESPCRQLRGPFLQVRDLDFRGQEGKAALEPEEGLSLFYKWGKDALCLGPREGTIRKEETKFSEEDSGREWEPSRGRRS